MTHRGTWKAMERRVAARFGTKRTALSGSNGGVSASDSMHPRIFVECKYRQKHATYQLWLETFEKAKKENKTPVVVLKEKGRKGELYVVHGDDLETVLSELLKAKEGG